jgi:pyroglutamyl-peptidase
MGALFTGFGAFPGVSVNPTELLIARWQRSLERRPTNQCECYVLPTEYRGSEAAIRDLLDRHNPRLLIMLGVKPSAATISLERYALNIDDSSAPDAAGEIRDGTPISTGGPEALMTSIDLIALRNGMLAREYSIEISNHAGTYVCNHAYYHALNLVESENRPTQVLFVHVPMHPLLGRCDIFESGALQYLESAIRDVWRYLDRRLDSLGAAT